MARRPQALPPGPPIPAIATALAYAARPLDTFLWLHRRYGDVFSISFPGFGQVAYVADPALVKELFTGDPAALHAGAANAGVLEPAVGPHSVLTLDGDEHMRQRKLLLPPFHGERVRAYNEVIRECADRDIDAWPVGRSFALRPRMEAITLGVILRAVFGVRGAERLELARNVVGEFARRSHAIVLLRPMRRSFLGVGPWDRFLRAREALDRLIYEEIAARRAEGEDRDDVLSLLMRARHENGSPMSDGELRDELVTVIGAGHETTATALAWAFERLLRSPRVMATLRERLDDDDYVDAVVKETLRIRPVIVDVARMTTRPLDIGGHAIPAGTVLLAAIAALHFREDLYPDPHEFRPERFLEGGTDSYAWIPFGGGVRRCVGAAFAQYEMRIVLRAVVERTELRAERLRAERPRPRNITLAPGRGTRVVMTRAPRPAVRREPAAPAASVA